MKDILSKACTQLPEGVLVSVHVRRADYLNIPEHHTNLQVEYYERAMKNFEGYSPVIFSDDIEWCKNNLNFNNMVLVEGNSDVEDLWLMSLCKNNIIVNSSFSWWGAYLNKNVDKVVIAPSKWFGDGVSLSTEDIVPEQWNKI